MRIWSRSFVSTHTIRHGMKKIKWPAKGFGNFYAVAPSNKEKLKSNKRSILKYQ